MYIRILFVNRVHALLVNTVYTHRYTRIGFIKCTLYIFHEFCFTYTLQDDHNRIRKGVHRHGY